MQMQYHSCLWNPIFLETSRAQRSPSHKQGQQTSYMGLVFRYQKQESDLCWTARHSCNDRNCPEIPNGTRDPAAFRSGPLQGGGQCKQEEGLVSASSPRACSDLCDGWLHWLRNRESLHCFVPKPQPSPATGILLPQSPSSSVQIRLTNAFLRAWRSRA